MKLNIISLTVTVIFLTSVSLYAEGVEDPIKNSYIINSLQMESKTDPFTATSEVYSGEIIFDNTIDVTPLNMRREQKAEGVNKDLLKELRKKDPRWHLVEYKVRKNDSLWTISRKFGVKSSEISTLNNLSPERILRINEIILIPSKSGVTYKVRKGDTLISISDKFETDIEKIAGHNNIDSHKIYAGRSIFIPGAVEKKDVEAVQQRKSKPDKEPLIVARRTEKKTPAFKDEKLRLSWPLKGPVTSGFGYRTHPFSQQKSFHCGMDIGAEIGTPVRAAGEGKVIFSGWKEAYGNLIVIQHKNDYITVYAHNSKLLAGADETVKKGQKIALSGKTGAVTGAHLHFEIRKGIVPIDPARILK